MIRLRAKVLFLKNKAPGLTYMPPPTVVGDYESPDPAELEISEDGDGFCLFGLDEGGKCAWDTWHETLEEAKAQADFDYEVGDWTEVR
jgi:hypothetical protein